MFINLINGTQFYCPWCGQGMEIDSWDTEYGDPMPGDNNVTCIKCPKKIGIYVMIETKVVTNSIAGQLGYEKSYAYKQENK